MKFRMQPTDVENPFGDPFVDPFGAPPAPEPDPPATTPGEVNTLATLSVVFAFVFAPAGVVLGHLAMSQIKRRPQPGRRRAVLGLTLSYALIVLGIVALVVWLLLGTDGGRDDRPMTNTSAPTGAPEVRSTVVTPPARGRPRVSVASLRVGDCVEIQKNQPDPTRPHADQVYIYRARCEVRDGIFQVSQKTTSADQCPPGEYLTNEQQTIVACFVKYGH